MGDPIEENEPLAGRHPRLVGTKSGDVFLYVDLLTGNKFTSLEPIYGKVPADRSLDAKQSFTVITVSEQRGSPRSVLLDGQELILSQTGARIFRRPSAARPPFTLR